MKPIDPVAAQLERRQVRFAKQRIDVLDRWTARRARGALEYLRGIKARRRYQLLSGRVSEDFHDIKLPKNWGKVGGVRF